MSGRPLSPFLPLYLVGVTTDESFNPSEISGESICGKCEMR